MRIPPRVAQSRVALRGLPELLMSMALGRLAPADRSGPRRKQSPVVGFDDNRAASASRAPNPGRKRVANDVEPGLIGDEHSNIPGRRAFAAGKPQLDVIVGVHETAPASDRKFHSTGLIGLEKLFNGRKKWAGRP